MSTTEQKTRKKYRKADCLDLEKMQPIFCIEIYYDNRWMRVGDDKGFYRWNNEAARDAKLAELRAEARKERRHAN